MDGPRRNSLLYPTLLWLASRHGLARHTCLIVLYYMKRDWSVIECKDRISVIELNIGTENHDKIPKSPSKDVKMTRNEIWQVWAKVLGFKGQIWIENWLLHPKLIKWENVGGLEKGFSQVQFKKTERASSSGFSFVVTNLWPWGKYLRTVGKIPIKLVIFLLLPSSYSTVFDVVPGVSNTSTQWRH